MHIRDDFKDFVKGKNFNTLPIPTYRQCYPDAPVAMPPYRNREYQENYPGMLPRWDIAESGEKALDFVIGRGRQTDDPMLAEKWQYFFFDHEAAHLVSDEQLPPRNPRDPDCIATVISESVSDIYAMIRHYQRFGEDSDFAREVMDWRRVSLIHFIDHSHYTIPALKQLEKTRGTEAIARMTPAESFELSMKIARSHFYHADMNKVFERSFSSLAKTFHRKKLDGSFLNRVAKTGHRTKFHAVREASLAYMDWAERHWPLKNMQGFDFAAARTHIKGAGPAPQKGMLAQVFSKVFSGKAPPTAGVSLSAGPAMEPKRR